MIPHASSLNPRPSSPIPLPSSPSYVLGLDSGGSKTEAILVDSSGQVLGRGYCHFTDPASGRGPGGSGRTDASVRQAVSMALSGICIAEANRISVVGRGSLPRGLLPDAVVAHARFYPVREPDGPMALARCQAGVVVLAGTGAFVYGRAKDGREVHLDSLGPLLGDAGSGFDIGLRALRAIARAGWHPRHGTTLVEPIVTACRTYAGKERSFSLVEYMVQCRDRSEIASLAQIVNEHAEAGDAVASRVLREAADAIAETLHDVVDRLDLREAALPLIAAGNVARRSRIYWRRVCEHALRLAPRLTPTAPAHQEVVGSILAAAKHIPGLARGFRDRLLAETDNGLH